jgi:hypothetical protein
MLTVSSLASQNNLGVVPVVFVEGDVAVGGDV